MYKTIIRLLIVAAATYFVPTLRLPNETVLLIVVGSAVGFLLLDNIMDDTLEGIDPDSPELDSPESGLDTTVWYDAKDVTIDTFSTARQGILPGVSSKVTMTIPALFSYKQPDKKYQFKFEKNDDDDSTYYIKIREKDSGIDTEYLGKNKYLPLLGVVKGKYFTKMAFNVTKKQDIENAYEIVDTNGFPVITEKSRQYGPYIVDAKNRTPDSADFFELIHPSPPSVNIDPTTTPATTPTTTPTTPTPTTPTPTTPKSEEKWYKKSENLPYIIGGIVAYVILLIIIMVT